MHVSYVVGLAIFQKGLMRNAHVGCTHLTALSERTRVFTTLFPSNVSFLANDKK